MDEKEEQLFPPVQISFGASAPTRAVWTCDNQDRARFVRYLKQCMTEDVAIEYRPDNLEVFWEDEVDEEMTAEAVFRVTQNNAHMALRGTTSHPITLSINA